MTDAELRDAAVVELKKTTQGYLKSNGDPRPVVGTQWKKGLDLLAQIGQVGPPPPPSSTPALEFPSAAHIWGGNSSAAMQVCDIVIVSNVGDAIPNNYRGANPKLIALVNGSWDPFASYPNQKTHAFTYGAGLSAFPGKTDNLNPTPLGAIRAFQSSDNGCMQTDGLQGFKLNSSTTAAFIRDVLWYEWKLGQDVDRGYNGLWSDNLFTSNLLSSGNVYGSCGSTIPSADWRAGFITICQGLRGRGVPIVGGNTSYRASDSAERAATNAAMNEVLRINIDQGASAFANMLAEVNAWYAAEAGNRYLVAMDLVQQAETAKMRFGLACACIMGAAYMPYSGNHSSLYFPSEMSPRRRYGTPLGIATRSGNTWTRQFQHGAVSANFDNQTASFA